MMAPRKDGDGVFRGLVFVLCLGSGVFLAALFLPALLTAQEADQNPNPQPDQAAAALAPAGPLATVHGMVRNAASGEPLPHALVRIDGDARAGALTDGDGRFEISGVPVGPQQFEVIKPGFLDAANELAAAATWVSFDYAHNVIVAPQMADVNFTMTPVNAIHGQIQLSTGDPAEGMAVTLLRRAIQDGRASWQTASTTKTNSEGSYRFGGLADGLYAVYSEPAMDSEPATNLVAAGSAGDVARGGYASVFYPDARDLAGAAKMRLAGGEQREANLFLTLEPFHTVMATVTFPDGRRSTDGERAGMNYTALVMDAQGHQLPYGAQYDQGTRTVQTMLPDGGYLLLVTATASRAAAGLTANDLASAALGAASLSGQVDFSVAGHAVAKLRVPLSPARGNPVQVSLIRTSAQLPQGGAAPVFIFLSQTGGWLADGLVSTWAQGPPSGPLETASVPPGVYWARTSIAQKGLCEGSLTAGGASLAREPLAMGLAGPAAPVALTLRDDCARLTLTLPASLDVLAAGEEPFYTVYVVPDFDSTVDVVTQTLRPSTGSTVTLEGLTPGDYHVYTFDQSVVLEYRNPAVLAALPHPGQAVTLAPGSSGNLVVEAPEP